MAMTAKMAADPLEIVAEEVSHHQDLVTAILAVVEAAWALEEEQAGEAAAWVPRIPSAKRRRLLELESQMSPDPSWGPMLADLESPVAA